MPNASEASVSTPVMTIFLPFKIPTHSTVVGLDGFQLEQWFVPTTRWIKLVF